MEVYNPRQYARDVSLLGRRLFKLAVSWSRLDESGYLRKPTSKKGRLEAVLACKGAKKFKTKKQASEAAERMGDIADAMSQSRAARRRGRILPKGGRNYRSFMLGENCIPILPTGTLEERKLRRRKALIILASAHQRPEYSGETRTEILYGKPSARTVTCRGEKYGGYSPYKKTDATHKITVHPEWFQRVHLRGLDSVGGMLTLDAEPYSEGGYTVYKATWLRSKNKRLHEEKGYIALGASGAAHAKTAAGAKALLTRRKTESRNSRVEAKIRSVLSDLPSSEYDNVQVRVADSIAAGNCRSGTMEFRDKHFPGRDSASVREILDVKSMRSLAVNACLRAVLKERNKIKKGNYGKESYKEN
jgi:hypothetical protein